MNLAQRWLVMLALSLILAGCAGSSAPLDEPAPSSSGQVAASLVASDAPSASGFGSEQLKLEILDPRAGATIKLPADIHYRITGMYPPANARIRVSAENLPEFEIPLPQDGGTLVLPDDKMSFLPGFRDVTFELVAADGTRLAEPVTVDDLTIEGRRGG